MCRQATRHTWGATTILISLLGKKAPDKVGTPLELKTLPIETAFRTQGNELCREIPEGAAFESDLRSIEVAVKNG